MAVNLLARCLRQLSIASVNGASKVLTKPDAIKLTEYPLISALLPAQRCQLQTSAALCRNLDSRRVKPSRLPSKRTGRWEPRKKMSEMYDYTVEPLPFPRTGGRGPNGRIWNHRRGGGRKREFRMIDWNRGGPSEGPPLVERVDHVMEDPMRSGHIALVAHGEHKRYVIATQNMKAGDLIRSSRHISKTAVRAQEGDSHPLGSLPLGTLVNCVEIYPEAGASRARAAGVTATLVRKLDDRCIVRLPSKREMNVSSACIATVGRVSNIDHNKRVIGKAGRNRWLGIRPRSGRWHRKDGRFGRKIRPLPPTQVFDEPPPPRPPVYQMFHV